MEVLANEFKTIKVREQWGALHIQIYRPNANNSIDRLLINELLQVFDKVEKVPSIKALVFYGNDKAFCTGMDFRSIRQQGMDAWTKEDSHSYYELLKRMVSISKVVVAKVEGKVNAGGIGIVAASDMVIAGPNSNYGLSEALFGLMPACVMPFLIRRVGPHKAQWMTLSTQAINASKAYEIGLVDESVRDTNDAVRRHLLRLTRLDIDTIGMIKGYISDLWILNQNTQRLAVDKLTSLMNAAHIKKNIADYVDHGKFPWN